MRFTSALLLSIFFAPCAARAQTPDSLALAPAYWRQIAYGATTSILLHETAHVLTSLAVGGHPTFGFDRLRPTIYSGITLSAEPHKQFWFSASGLLSQSLLDEGILDVPHSRGGAFERGLLGGGIGTALFYLTIGRRGSVSDVEYMARTRVLTATQVTLLFGAVAASHIVRMSRDGHYANFFARPRDGAFDVGFGLGGF
jgi:hypothetical protein